MPDPLRQASLKQFLLLFLLLTLSTPAFARHEGSHTPSPEADLELTLALSDNMPTVGDQITITIRVFNFGPQTPESVAAAYRLPDGLTFIEATFSDGTDTYNPATGRWEIGAIPTDQLMQVPMMQLNITARVTEAGQTEHIAEVIASSRPDPDSTPGNDDPDEDDYDRATLNAEAAAVLDLILTKRAAGTTAAPDGTLIYTLNYTNAGLPATGVIITEMVPLHTTYDAAVSTVGWVQTGTSQDGRPIYSFGLGNVQGGTSGMILFAVRVDATVPNDVAILINTASISDDGSQGADAMPDNNTSTVETTIVQPGEADLSLTASTSQEAPAVGTQIMLMVQVMNAGPEAATGVVILVALPSGLAHVSDTSGGAYQPASGVWTVGAVANGGTATLTLIAEITQVGAGMVEAVVAAADQPDPDSTPGGGTANEDDVARLTITGQLAAPDLEAPVSGALMVARPIDLAWEAVPGAAVYEIQVDEEGGDFSTLVFAAETDALTVQTDGLLPSSNYRWRVRGRATTGAVSPWSDEWLFVTQDSGVGVEEEAGVPAGYTVSAAYPNPFAEQTTLSLMVRQTQDVQIDVYDVLGRRVEVLFDDVMAANQQKIVTWQPTAPPGLYTIRILGTHFSETRRVVLAK